jgi:hypothetical protein
MALIAQYDLSDPTSYSGTGNILYDTSGNGNNLALYNSPTFSGTGQSKTLLFDNTLPQYALTPNVLGASVPTTITINAWLKSYLDASTFRSAFYFGNSSITQYAFGWSDYGNGDNWLFEMTTNSAQINTSVSSNSPNFVNIILSIGSGTYTAYINGLQVGSSSHSLASWINPIIQLNSYGGATPSRAGTYDYALFEVYDSAYNLGQVTSLYNSQASRFLGGPAGVPTPVGEYDFSDVSSYPGTGGTLYDLSGTGNTLNNPTLSGTFAGSGQSKYYSFAGGADQFYKDAVAGFAGTILTTASAFIWVKSSDWNNPANSNQYRYMTGWGLDTGTGGGHIGFTKKLPSTAPPFYPDVPGAMCGSGFGFTAYSSGLANSQWYHLGYVIDGTNANLYLDGVLVGQVPQDFVYSVGLTGLLGSVQKDPAYANTPWMCLGGLYNNYAPASNYDIAIAEFYNVGLGSTQVTSLYNFQSARFPNTPPPYVGSVGGRRFGGRFAG